MNSRLVQLYIALFLTDQLFGIAFAMSGFLAPARQLLWSASLAARALGTLAILGSLALPVYVRLQRLPSVLHILPVFHLGGLLLLEALVRHEAGIIQVAQADLSAEVLRRAAVQGPDLLFASLAHSSLGLVLAVHVIGIAGTEPDAAR
jgi:hypothetical protein